MICRIFRLTQRSNDYKYGNEILTDAGKLSAEQAKLYVETEFEKYWIVQDRLFVSDYDKFLLEMEETVEE